MYTKTAHIRSFAAASVGALMLVAPFVASADVLGDVQTKIAALLAQVRDLQVRILQLQQGSGSGAVACTADAKQCPDGSYVGRTGPNCEFAACPGASSGSSSSAGGVPACPVLFRTLTLGSSGQDVSDLQNFLIQNGFLQANATGYFGALTRIAVQKWQVQNGIVSSNISVGAGIVGPVTRGWIGKRCGTLPPNTVQDFSVDTAVGDAPLSVTFATNDSTASGNTYHVDFGDGASADMARGGCVGIAAIVGGQGGIRCGYTAVHTYTTAGTYTAKLFKQLPFSCPAGMVCATVMPAPVLVGTLTITVRDGGVASTSFSASPTSGAAPLNVNFSLQAASAFGGEYVVDFGDGATGRVSVPSIVCIRAPCIPGPQTISHTYAVPGTYTAILMPYIACVYSNPRCMIAVMPIGTASITANSQ